MLLNGSAAHQLARCRPRCAQMLLDLQLAFIHTLEGMLSDAGLSNIQSSQRRVQNVNIRWHSAAMPIVSPIPLNPLFDGRQSERAMVIRRGVQRMLGQMGA